MIPFRKMLITLSLLTLLSCKTTIPNQNRNQGKDIIAVINEPKIEKRAFLKSGDTIVPLSDNTFVNLKNFSSDFIFDMKYATSDNFLKSKVYDCAECYLRLKTVLALLKANSDAMAKGYRIKLFDCYRPLDVQKRMWKIVSNPAYVADPEKGSIHNRGGAVDITLVDREGKELDMGTAFDHFGPEAAPSYKKLPKKVLANRKILIDLMKDHGFSVLKSEWWHFDLVNASTEKISNFKWECN